MRRILAGVVAGTLLLSGCAREDDKSIEDVVRALVKAENAKDADAFLALWTDKGLESYDVGSREEVKSGKSENFGSDRIEILDFPDTKVTGDSATATVDGLRGENQIAKPMFRVRFALIEKGGKWKLNGFEFIGSPPPARGAKVVGVKAQEYAFALDATQATGELAFRFSNVGKEHHELTIFKGPDGVDVLTAKKTLENVDGRELKDIPNGYKADHVSFAEPGKSADVTFAEPLAKGTWVLACYIPQGGFTKEDEPVNPQGKPHIQLGMIAILTVT